MRASNEYVSRAIQLEGYAVSPVRNHHSLIGFPDLVMGLHWAPQPALAQSDPTNLDAICILLDRQMRPLEAIRPGHLKNSNGSVMHTGDSRTGASSWDDERIFVFLHALPSNVDSVVFKVVSINARGFCDVAGATCHISDSRTEDELLRVQLTSLGADTVCCVATLQRSEFGWLMTRRSPPSC